MLIAYFGQYLKKEKWGKCEIKGAKSQLPSDFVKSWFELFKLSIFGVILEKQVQNFVNSVPDESFNNSFIFDFQPGFLGALSSLKRLVSGDVLLSYISNKVRFNPTLISEDTIGLKFNYTHISFISKSNAKFPKLY